MSFIVLAELVQFFQKVLFVPLTTPNLIVNKLALFFIDTLVFTDWEMAYRSYRVRCLHRFNRFCSMLWFRLKWEMHTKEGPGLSQPNYYYLFVHCCQLVRNTSFQRKIVCLIQKRCNWWWYRQLMALLENWCFSDVLMGFNLLSTQTFSRLLLAYVFLPSPLVFFSTCNFLFCFTLPFLSLSFLFF